MSTTLKALEAMDFTAISAQNKKLATGIGVALEFIGNVKPSDVAQLEPDKKRDLCTAFRAKNAIGEIDILTNIATYKDIALCISNGTVTEQYGQIIDKGELRDIKTDTDIANYIGIDKRRISEYKTVCEAGIETLNTVSDWALGHIVALAKAVNAKAYTREQLFKMDKKAIEELTDSAIKEAVAKANKVDIKPKAPTKAEQAILAKIEAKAKAEEEEAEKKRKEALENNEDGTITVDEKSKTVLLENVSVTRFLAWVHTSVSTNTKLDGKKLTITVKFPKK